MKLLQGYKSCHDSRMQSHRISRRSLLLGTMGLGITYSTHGLSAQAKDKKIITVRGPINKIDLGPALPHEHIMCDFVGAESTGPHRWEKTKVIQRMLPYVNALKQTGMTTLFDCTPAYIGRDPLLLRRISEASHVNIVTNTGFYGGANDKYVPQKAYNMSSQTMADHWANEYENGIENTDIRPGFMKIGVDPIESEDASLSPIDTTIVSAAAIASKRTGLSVTCHTGGGLAGLAALKLFIEQGGKAESFIVAHADNHGLTINRKVTDLGGWVSFDAIGRRPLKQHLEIVPSMLSYRADRLLISQDNGWYSVGEPDGGDVRGYTDLMNTFLPALEKTGITSKQIHDLIQQNPWNAFAI